jgi:hypothetical protein
MQKEEIPITKMLYTYVFDEHDGDYNEDQYVLAQGDQDNKSNISIEGDLEIQNEVSHKNVLSEQDIQNNESGLVKENNSNHEGNQADNPPGANENVENDIFFENEHNQDDENNENDEVSQFKLLLPVDKEKERIKKSRKKETKAYREINLCKRKWKLVFINDVGDDIETRYFAIKETQKLLCTAVDKTFHRFALMTLKSQFTTKDRNYEDYINDPDALDDMYKVYRTRDMYAESNLESIQEKIKLADENFTKKFMHQIKAHLFSSECVYIKPQNELTKSEPLKRTEPVKGLSLRPALSVSLNGRTRDSPRRINRTTERISA